MQNLKGQKAATSYFCLGAFRLKTYLNPGILPMVHRGLITTRRSPVSVASLVHALIL